MIWLLAFVFLLVLKLTEAIDWSWWVVCLPLLIPAGLYALAFALCVIAELIDN